MSELIDNRANRIRNLKEIIRHLHRGGSPDDVRDRLRRIVGQTDAAEIAAMEGELMAEGMPAEEVQSMCDLHSSVLREILVAPPDPVLPPGHPADTFRRENGAISGRLARMRALLGKVAALPDEAVPSGEIESLRGIFNELMDVEKHYRRKEHLLFSCLERHGITGPSKVMWGKDDEVRALLEALGEALAAGPATAGEWKLAAETVARPALDAVEEMVHKEERILLPMSLSTLTEDEWAEVFESTPEYGYCLVEPLEGYRPPAPAGPGRTAAVSSGESLVFPTGAITPEQLAGIFRALPVDITFVDADDRVRYFSEGDRIFERSKAILGRKVQHCHPPASVGTVQKIIDDFRAGRQDVAEFWIEMRGRFIHIRYFPVRDADGAYLGTLEVTQDLTRLRGLEGERRLLSYEDGGAA